MIQALESKGLAPKAQFLGAKSNDFNPKNFSRNLSLGVAKLGVPLYPYCIGHGSPRAKGNEMARTKNQAAELLAFDTEDINSSDFDSLAFMCMTAARNGEKIFRGSTNDFLVYVRAQKASNAAALANELFAHMDREDGRWFARDFEVSAK